jgi:glycosyltransferase involved in cell wall biosynthesis
MMPVAVDQVEPRGSREMRGRVLVVSHPSAAAANQSVYVELRELGWDLTLVAPRQWRHEHASRPTQTVALDGLEDCFVPISVGWSGRPQRHFYLARAGHLIRGTRPDVAFVEEESFSVPAFQWGRALAGAGIPFGVQMFENLDRKLPAVARAIRAWVLERADFVAARSPRAGELVRRWGFNGEVRFAPHAVPPWQPHQRTVSGVFTIGFAGRLVPEKGIADLMQAARRIAGPARVLFVGDGPLATRLEAQSSPELEVQVRSDLTHERMPEAYGEMDVLVLPSRTTPRWVEQFGRVLVEALWCGVPVVGSDSGEIPWVIEQTGGGVVFPEGDVDALARVLNELRMRPSERRRLAEQGKERVRRLFSVEAAGAALDAALVGAMSRRSARAC